ncbi:MAG: ABC transporter permease [Saccharofermentanales bacterium]
MKKKIELNKAFLVLLIIVICVIATIINPRFATQDNFVSIARQISAPGILAVGMTFVLLTGGIDLSAGYGITLGAIAMGLVYNYSNNPWLSMLGAIIACAILGLLNGILITQLNIVPFIATLATMSITQGVLNIIALGSKFFLKNEVFAFIAVGELFNLKILPISTLIFLLIFIMGVIILKHTKLGRYVYSIGSSEKNTAIAGINTEKYKMLVYIISGITMGIASIVMASRISQVTQESGGNVYLMDAIAAAILGGTDISGGKGDIIGTLLGVIFLGIISNLLVFLSIPTIAQQFFKGIVIILALVVNHISGVLKEKEDLSSQSRSFIK